MNAAPPPIQNPQVEADQPIVYVATDIKVRVGLTWTSQGTAVPVIRYEDYERTLRAAEQRGFLRGQNAGRDEHAAHLAAARALLMNTLRCAERDNMAPHRTRSGVRVSLSHRHIERIRAMLTHIPRRHAHEPEA